MGSMFILIIPVEECTSTVGEAREEVDRGGATGVSIETMGIMEGSTGPAGGCSAMVGSETGAPTGTMGGGTTGITEGTMGPAGGHSAVVAGGFIGITGGSAGMAGCSAM